MKLLCIHVNSLAKLINIFLCNYLGNNLIYHTEEDENLK